MLSVVLILFIAIVLASYFKGEIQFVRDNLEIQLRQARFRLDRLELRVRELEESAASAPQTASSAVKTDSSLP